MDQYSVGERSIAELLDAIINDRNTSTALVETYFDYFVELASLVREVGWSPHQNDRTAGQELLSRLTELVESGR